ncbi:peptidase domain-containing ABC transporter [Adhaeretor mobilis]|uniref:Alpha-hemolysin translocation ATP-binding protein HlyB n=1 Tax=Adhaeretor mobilis TaxID=1930276 RepID=A0A517MRA4_9BACT|nr:ABC transporter ATP-binding protein [Adhaeretor mobilis]QDS97412.1 Alpha-hemolysin translocation ATP-binding protein HlyB [Adhaeretor mobilis]
MSDDLSQSQYDLAAIIVQITRELGTGVEHLRAEQLVVESRSSSPGDFEAKWQDWLTAAVKSLGLQVRQLEIARDEAFSLAENGALLVGRIGERSTPALLMKQAGNKASIFVAAQDESSQLSADSLPPDYSIDDANGEPEKSSWLLVSDAEFSHEHASKFEDNPVRRFFALLRAEWSDVWVVAVFAFFAGLLNLATPIAVEALVNLVAFGRLLQPLLVLSILLFGFLSFAAMMRALQTFVVEIIQRRLFVRIAADLAYRFPRINRESLHEHYGPELANRFFDVVTLQKVVAQLLLDGMAIILTTFIGMAVLAFYHPWLLGFDVLLLVIVVGGVYLLGRGAIKSGIDESKEKYRLAAWLEDVIRCSVGFKLAGGAEFAIDRANLITAEYLAARRAHFALLFRQMLFILSLQAIAGTVLLGFGGWLVIQRQLTLGQLVAAELIVATILGSLAKLGKHIEGFYDVIASVDKLGHLFDIEIEPQDGVLALNPGTGARLRLTEVRHSAGGPLLNRGLTLSAESGERIALLLPYETGSCVLFDVLYGLRLPEGGHVEIEHSDPRDLNPETLRSAVALVRGAEIFEGTIAENVHLGRPGVSMSDVRWALHLAGILDDVLRLPEGLDTPLNATGLPLRYIQQHLLMLARAVAAKPRVLLIDGLLDLLGDVQFHSVYEALCDPSREWTLLVATAKPEVASRFERTVEIDSEAKR